MLFDQLDYDEQIQLERDYKRRYARFLKRRRKRPGPHLNPAVAVIALAECNATPSELKNVPQDEADALRRAFGTRPNRRLKLAQQDDLFDPAPQGRIIFE